MTDEVCIILDGKEVRSLGDALNKFTAVRGALATVLYKAAYYKKHGRYPI